MALRDTTRKIIAEVEKTSGFPVIVSEDANLPLLATVKIARGGAQAHSIVWNPRVGAAPDYVIAFQCGFILRLFARPADQRFDLASTTKGRDIVDKLVQRNPAIPRNAVSQFRDQLFDGLMRQLRSVPVGLRVDSWIRREYPDLHALQQQGAMQQLQENQGTLSPNIQKIVPAELFRASVGMNAAFANFWAGALNNESLRLAYKAAGFAKAGDDLMAIYDHIPDDPRDDCTLVDRWAEKLGVVGWYQWVPFDVG